jgi:hypothetical protein
MTPPSDSNYESSIWKLIDIRDGEINGYIQEELFK